MNNYITFLNDGAKKVFDGMTLALLSTSLMKDNDEVVGYRAEILPLSDSNRYVKRDGEVVDGPNALHSFTIIVNSPDIPNNSGMVQNIKLVNPRFVSAFATSQLNSTFATIRSTLMCDDIIIPSSQHQQGSAKRGDH